MAYANPPETGRPVAIPRTSPIIARLSQWRRRGFLADDRVRHEA